MGSFRRQVYLHPNDIHRLPSTLLINYDQTDCRIFFSDNTVLCYICKQIDHTSNHCKKDIPIALIAITTPSISEEINIDINIQQDSNTIDKYHINKDHIIEQNSQ
jgi:hypothetical protein